MKQLIVKSVKLNAIKYVLLDIRNNNAVLSNKITVRFVKINVISQNIY